jgi:hypothetical protein
MQNPNLLIWKPELQVVDFDKFTLLDHLEKYLAIPPVLTASVV